MPGIQTPAEKSAEQLHLRAGDRSTYCGIQFKRQQFLERKITGDDKLCTCLKCSTAYAVSKGS